MKKLIFAIAVCSASAAMFPDHSLAQGTQDRTGLASAQPNQAHVQLKFFPANASPNASDASTINLKAIKDFKTRFAAATDEKWFTMDGGYMSYFKQDGYGDRAYYDKKGRWQYSLKFYGENKLPRDVRAQVKSTYYDFTITVVELIEVGDRCAYLVHLEDASNIKIVRVTDEGEMTVLEEFTKA
jgi:hypothetical protein